MTGWTLSVKRVASLNPMPKSQLAWKGTLMSDATGFGQIPGDGCFLRVDGWNGASESGDQCG